MTDRAVCRDVTDAVARALSGGVTAVMLREKDLGTRELVSAARGIAASCRRSGALLLVNGDPEAAAELGADGVHLGFRSVGVAAARAMAGEDAIVGRSTHDAEELARAILEGADYVTFGPVHDTPSKRGLVAPCGLGGLREAVLAAGRVPVVALGGLDASNAAPARATGVAGIACVRAILTASDPAEAARAMSDAAGSAR